MGRKDITSVGHSGGSRRGQTDLSGRREVSNATTYQACGEPKVCDLGHKRPPRARPLALDKEVSRLEVVVENVVSVKVKHSLDMTGKGKQGGKKL